MRKPRLWALLILITSLTLSGCFVEYYKTPSLKVVNKYHLPITEIAIGGATGINASRYYDYYIKVNIPKGKSNTFELDYLDSLEAYIKVSCESEYDIKIVKLTVGKTTTVTLNENGILK